MQQPDLILGRHPVGTVGYVGTPINPEEFTWSLVQLVQFCYEYMLPPGTHLHVDRSVVSGQAGARNELVKKMQGDWLLQIDTDHTFDPDLVMRMIQLFEGQKLDVLTGLYHFKQQPYNPVLFQHVGKEYRAVVNWDHKEDVRLLPISAAGGGCLLVRRSVFDRIRKETGAMPFDPCPPYTTDDFNFFERCRRLGIKCWCAPQIEMKHLMWKSIGSGDYNPAPYEATATVLADAMA